MQSAVLIRILCYRHTHCMWKPTDPDHDRLGGAIPAVCTTEPAHGSGFCHHHSDVLTELGWPTDLREFLKKCGTNPKGFDKIAARKVDEILTTLDKQASQLGNSADSSSSPKPSESAYTKTTNYFLRSQAVAAGDFSAEKEDDDDKCNKVGRRQGIFIILVIGRLELKKCLKVRQKLGTRKNLKI